jgi:hypothetical protein
VKPTTAPNLTVTAGSVGVVARSRGSDAALDYVADPDDLTVDRPDLRVWLLTVDTKEARVSGLRGGDVHVSTGPGAVDTVVSTGLPDGWEVIADVSRYTLRIVAWLS